jgi:hypothetical protein
MTISTPLKPDFYRSVMAIGNRVVVVLCDPGVQAKGIAFAADCRAAFGPAKGAVRSGAHLARELAYTWRRLGSPL